MPATDSSQTAARPGSPPSQMTRSPTASEHSSTSLSSRRSCLRSSSTNSNHWRLAFRRYGRSGPEFFALSSILPKRASVMVPNRVQAHPSGTSNGVSSLETPVVAFGVRISPALWSRAFSAAMRLSSTLAGSSSGSCGTSFPRTASWSTSSRSRFTPSGASASVSNAAIKSCGVIPGLRPRGPRRAPGAAPHAAPPLPPAPCRSAPAGRRGPRDSCPGRSGW